MGIRGLSTFIARYSDKYLEDYKLKDCQLVIDGHSLTAQMYVNSANFNCAFGGDYDRYAVSVIEFFCLLQKCRIAPLVVFDGGYERRKFRTAFSRLKQKWRAAKHVSPVTQSRNKIFPCLLREAFKDILRQLHIPFAQCLFEADEEVAAVAKRLKCPVLSYDSDFFVYDVLYIPFPTLRLHPYKDESAQSSNVSYYLSCSLYRVENFLKRYGGLQKEILPLFSIMLGNDYVGNRAFECFVSHLKQHKSRGSNSKQRRIPALLGWLQNETLETATAKVMGLLRKEKRHHVAEQVRRVVALYVECSSALLPVLGIEDCDCEVETSDKMNSVKQLLEEHLDMNNSCHGILDETDPADVDSSDDSCSTSSRSSDEEGDMSGMENLEDGHESELNMDSAGGKEKAFEYSDMEKASHLPKWFLEKFQQGALPPALMDMFVHNHYFVPPQVEDYDCPSSHTISLPVIAVIYGLLVGPERKMFLNCHVRKSREPTLHNVVYPVLETASVKFSSLEHLPKLSLCQRILILEETAGLSTFDRQLVALLPLSWQLYVISIVFWAKQTEQTEVNSSHVDALLLCMLLLDVVGKNSVCLGSAKKTRRGRKKVIKKINVCGNVETSFQPAPSVGNHGQFDVLQKDVQHISTKNLVKTEDSCSQIISENDFRQNSISKQNMDTDEVVELHRKSVILLQTLETPNLEECVLAKKILRPWSLMDEKMKTRPRLFCVATVHTFAQFQSCLLHFTYLNAILDFPLSHCISFRVFCGTFVYNMYHNLKQRSDALAYISQLMSVAPSFLSLFTILREMVGKLIPEVPTISKIKRNPRKKKQEHCSRNENVEMLRDKQNQSTDSDFEDPCNRFAALSLKQK